MKDTGDEAQRSMPPLWLTVALAAANLALISVLLSSSASLRRERDGILAELNVTARANQNRLFFNRVPKAGTTSFVYVTHNISFENDFIFYKYRVTDDGLDSEIVSMGHPEQNTSVHYLTHDMCYSNETCAYYKHVRFINFEKYGEQNPIYINFVRHPVDRVISWFYYVRSTPYILNISDPLPIGMFKTSLDDCLHNNSITGYECDVSLETTDNTLDILMKMQKKTKFSLPPIEIAKKILLPVSRNPEERHGSSDQVSSQLDYFCGFEEFCSPTTSDRLKRLNKAIYNLENYYSVVGVLEHLQMSYEVLERYVPRYYRGLVNFRKDRLNSNQQQQRRLSDEARRKLEDYLEDEIIFYEYVKQRLHKQYWAL